MNYIFMYNNISPFYITLVNKQEFEKTVRFMKTPQDFALFLVYDRNVSKTKHRSAPELIGDLSPGISAAIGKAA